jgi:hypothetical protein
MTRESIQCEYDMLNRLEQTLSNLTAALVKQNEHLVRHKATMEKLAQAEVLLEATIKTRLLLESRKNSAVVDNLVKMFVEYEINPRYYYRERHHRRRDTANSKDAVLTLPGI